ncbi:DNA mismatch repair endonuclease MutL [soil metagenome]
MKIQLLSQAVISAIAAGEVIERPAVVVKELIENAIDAGATKIEIEITDDKEKRIRVSDDGSGIPAEELSIAIQRHTTSKLREVEELPQLLSLGFRGEALASIASVSRMTIHTRTTDAEVGQQLIVENGEVELQKPLGLPLGTTILVTQLFDQLPARKKFLKQAATEFRQVTEYVTAAALSQPEISFILIHNQKHVFDLAPCNLSVRAATLFGDQLFSQLVPFDLGQPYFSVHGLIGTPQLARRSNQKQFLFINGRSVSPTVTHHWVKESYGSLIEPKSEPFFVIFLELPPTTIDINVHPRKEIVRFLNEKEVYDFVTTAVKQALAQTDLTYQYHSISMSEWKVNDPITSSDRKGSSATESVLKQLVQPWKVLEEKPIILQLDFTYLITITKQGLIIVDQHAAHERILYNQFLAALTEMKSSNQAHAQHQLPTPLTLSFPASDSQMLRQHLLTLQEVGFEIDEFGANTFKISAVPMLVKDRSIPQLLNELIGDLLAGHSVKEVDSVEKRTVAYLACRSAVQAGDVLTEPQRQLLFEKLSATDQSFTCPHGRPTTITFSISDLEKLFKRK